MQKRTAAQQAQWETFTLRGDISGLNRWVLAVSQRIVKAARGKASHLQLAEITTKVDELRYLLQVLGDRVASSDRPKDEQPPTTQSVR